MKNHLAKLFLAAVSLLLIGLAPAQAQEKAAIEAFARKNEASCAFAYRNSPNSPLAKRRDPSWVKTILEGPSGKVVIVQAEQTRCKPVAQLICGTGGCPVAVFSVRKDGVRKWLDQQVLGWKRVMDGKEPALELQVHGSHCGGFGSEACVTMMNLRTGRQRTFKPRV